MKIGPKYKICRRLDEKVFTKCQTTKFSISGSANNTKINKPLRHRGRSISEYGSQLLEKQKARYTYGMNERQFARSVKEHREQTDLQRSLELRLDNGVFRLGWVPSRQAARQVVTHGHILVNNRRVSSPSYTLKIGDRIGIRPASLTSTLFRDLNERLKEYKIPIWLQVSTPNEGVVVAKPNIGETEMNLNFGAIIDFYRRV